MRTGRWLAVCVLFYLAFYTHNPELTPAVHYMPISYRYAHI